LSDLETKLSLNLALIEQFAAMSGPNGCRHQLNPHFKEEDDKFIIEEVQFQQKQLRLDAQN
jgi:hypothetical protein